MMKSHQAHSVLIREENKRAGPPGSANIKNRQSSIKAHMAQKTTSGQAAEGKLKIKVISETHSPPNGMT